MKVYVKCGMDEATMKNVDRIRKLVKDDRFYGKSDLVQSWAIITAENPLKKRESTPEENAALDHEFRKDLKSSHLEYIAIDGMNDSKENPLFVINPGLAHAKQIAEFYRQESFVYADVVRNDSIDGKFNDEVLMIYQYYKAKHPKAQKLEYILDDAREHCADAESSEAFLSMAKTGEHRFDWTIPVFEELFIQGCELIYEKYGWKRIPELVRETIDLIEYQSGGMAYFYKRCSLYSTIESEIKSLKTRINILERLKDRRKVDSLNSRYLPRDKNGPGRR